MGHILRKTLDTKKEWKLGLLGHVATYESSYRIAVKIVIYNNTYKPHPFLSPPNEVGGGGCGVIADDRPSLCPHLRFLEHISETHGGISFIFNTLIPYGMYMSFLGF